MVAECWRSTAIILMQAAHAGERIVVEPCTAEISGPAVGPSAPTWWICSTSRTSRACIVSKYTIIGGYRIDTFGQQRAFAAEGAMQNHLVAGVAQPCVAGWGFLEPQEVALIRRSESMLMAMVLPQSSGH